MKKYPTFKDTIERVRFGTHICVSEEFSGNVLLDVLWEHRERTIKFPSTLLMAEVTQYSVLDGKLCIFVVLQEGLQNE